tara:strand:- start:1918 stop:2232 length:315 start_codon:yes stop_codon:yes gene_type:complete
MEYVFGAQPPRNLADYKKCCDDLELLGLLRSHFKNYLEAQEEWEQSKEKYDQKCEEIETLERGAIPTDELQSRRRFVGDLMRCPNPDGDTSYNESEERLKKQRS